MIPNLRFKADDGSEFPEWEEKRLGEMMNVTSVKRVHASDWTETGVPFYRAREIVALHDGKQIAPLYISEDCYTRFSAISGEIEDGDLLVTGVGTIGVQYLVKPDDKFYFKDGNIIWIQNRGAMHGTYLYYCFDSNFVKQQISNMAGVGTVGTYTIDSAKQTVVYVPSLPEQKKIASFLSTIDEIIQSTESELTAWQERKKGVMQKIFNREVQFKADDGSEFPEWEEKKFGDVFENMNNNTYSRECLNYSVGVVKNIHYGDILVKFGACVDVGNEDIPYINEGLNFEKYNRLENGDIVIADTAEDDTVGKAVEIENNNHLDVVAGLHTIACRPKYEFAARYLGYYLNSDAYHFQLRPYMQGIKVTSISKTNIQLTTIQIPSLPEQKKIADCLSSLDDVINQIQAELSAWKEFKKGLLQQMFV